MTHLEAFGSWLTVAGLSLDIVGVVLLYIFGLPSRLMDRSGSKKRRYGFWIGRRATPAEIRLYECGSEIGLLLLIIGFLLQLIGAAAKI